MAERTEIAWADSTFNPWIGCTKVSPACDHCYASVSTPARSMNIAWGPGQRRHRTKTWGDPVKWDKAHEAFYAQHGRRQRVFCASLADVFDNEVDPTWLADLFRLIEATPNLDWLLLTKRIGNVERMVEASAPFHRLAPNVWLGATVVNQEEADRDIPKLLATPARVRFLSIEPMLGPVDLQPWLARNASPGPNGTFSDRTGVNGRLHWVICGGESGHGARPIHLSWVRSIRDQCAAAGVPFLWKQWGEWIPAGQPYPDAHVFPPIREFGYDEEGRHRLHRIGKKATGRLLDGQEHNGFPA